MALGHQASSSSSAYSPTTAVIASSVAAAAAEDTSTSSGQGQGSSSIQPPLILAFVALGVLTIGALLLFWSRRVRAIAWASAAAGGVPRYRYGDPLERAYDEHGRDRGGKAPVEVGERPKLFELSVVGLKEVKGDAKPLAAQLMPSVPSSTPHTTSALSPTPSSALTSLQTCFHLRRSKSPTVPTASPSEGVVQADGDRDHAPQPLQLSYPILLPQPPPHHHHHQHQRPSSDSSAPPPLFCLGQAVATWQPPPPGTDKDIDDVLGSLSAGPSKQSAGGEYGRRGRGPSAGTRRTRNTYADVIMGSPAPT